MCLGRPGLSGNGVSLAAPGPGPHNCMHRDSTSSLSCTEQERLELADQCSSLAAALKSCVFAWLCRRAEWFDVHHLTGALKFSSSWSWLALYR